jgi:hypothetical protein
MFLQPPVLALLLVSVVEMLVFAGIAPFALAVVRHWDLSASTARQLTLEKRTRLVTALMTFLAVLEMLVLPVFVFTADQLAPLLTGAMCAVGALNAHPAGFQALIAHVLAWLAAATWLALDHLDHQVPSYPLTRVTHVVALGTLPVFGAAAVLQWRYFLGLDPAVITSCCARVFAPGTETWAGQLATWPPAAAATVFISTTALAIGAAWLLRRRRAGSWLTLVGGLAGLAVLPATITAVVSFIGPAVYDDVLHHCPFCLLKAEYGYRGYTLYLPGFVSAAGGAGLLATLAGSRQPDLRGVVTHVRRRWAAAVLIGVVLVLGAAGIMVATSSVTLFP